MIDVCCAIILNNSKILAVQHGPESSHPWKWEFPGGKVHLGETAVQCIIREIDEELRVRVNVLTPLDPIEFDCNTIQIRLIPFICKIVSGDIVLTEHINDNWFDLKDWQSIDWLDADRELILKNQENIQLWMNRDTF